MDILRGDVAISKATLEELLVRYSRKFEIEVKSGIHTYDTDCPSHAKIQAIVDTLVILDNVVI